MLWGDGGATSRGDLSAALGLVVRESISEEVTES